MKEAALVLVQMASVGLTVKVSACIVRRLASVIVLVNYLYTVGFVGDRTIER